MAARAKRLELEVDGRELSISNPDKVLFPDDGITKAEMVRYYERIAPLLVRHSAGTPGRPSPLPRRHRQGRVLPEAGGQALSGLDPPGRAHDPGRQHRVRRHRGRGDRRLPGRPGRPGPAHPVQPGRRPVPTGRGHGRPRPLDPGPGTRAPRRGPPARAVPRPGLHRSGEDQRLPGAARGGRCRPPRLPRRPRPGPRGQRAARRRGARRVHPRVLQGEAGRPAPARHQPQRLPAARRGAVLAAGPARCSGRRAAGVGRGPCPPSGTLSGGRSRTSSAASPQRDDPWS